MFNLVLLFVYLLAVPVYMTSCSYLLNLYSNHGNSITSEVVLFYWTTIWIPIFLSLGINYVLMRHRKLTTPSKTDIHPYALSFVFVFSLYFVAFGQFFRSGDCLYSGLSGLLIVLFFPIFRYVVHKCVVYLPVAEKFYLNIITFVFPVIIMMATDATYLIQGRPWHMVILLAPISYIGGASLLIFVGICLKFYCHLRNISLKKNSFSLNQAILIVLLGTNMQLLYFVSYIGGTIFFIGLLMSSILYLTELFHHLFLTKRTS